MTVTTAALALGVVIGLMIAEARLSYRHEVALRARGAIEPAGDSYRLVSFIYPAAFLLMGAEGIWRAIEEKGAVASPGAPAWCAAGILLLLASKALKYWAIAHLGERWSFKVLVLPGVPLVRSGPYAYVNHPNYIAVFGELAGMALLMTAWITGPAMTFAYALWLRARLRVEMRALRGTAHTPTGSK